MKIIGRLYSPKKLVLSNGKVVEQPRTKMPFILAAFFIFTFISSKVTGLELSTLRENGDEFFTILFDMFPPNTAEISEIWEPLFDTIKMSLLGSFLGAFFALPLAILAASNIIKNRLVFMATRFMLSLIRTLPTLVIALIATYIFGLGTLAGSTAIFFFTFSYVGKLLYEQIETVDMGPFEAMEAMGLTRIDAFFYAIFPQVLPNYMSNSLFCFEGNVRYASILGYVGAGGLGLLISETIGWREYDKVGMTLIMLFLTVFVIENTSQYCRKKLN